MVKALFDTNILIDYLNGVAEARAELGRYYGEKAISMITWMEVMAGTTAETEIQTRAYLSTFALLQVDEGVAECAVKLRKKFRMKLPDAIIWATAQTWHMVLVTRNFKDFPAADPGVRIPYQL